jgi:hypothetical protein
MSQRGVGMADVEEGETIAWITAACRVATVALPRGERGVEAAIFWLQVFPAACRLGLGDVTDSAPGLYRLFVGAGLIPSCPSDSAMTGAIRLIASVSPVVTKRSARTWTAWVGSACDPSSPINAALRSAVTPAMLRVPTSAPTAPRRPGSIRSERDRLAADLVAVREELERARTSAAAQLNLLTAERDRAASAREEADLARRTATERADALSAERDRLAATLHSAGEKQRASDQALQRANRAQTEAQGVIQKQRRELDDHQRQWAEAAEVTRKAAEQFKSLMATNELQRTELERQAVRVKNLGEKLGAKEAELDGQSGRCRDIEAELALANAELERYASLLQAANVSLTQTRTERDGLRGDLNRESSAHAETRNRLQSAENRGLAYIRERDQFRAEAESIASARQALVDICKWLSIDPTGHPDVSATVEAILSAIDRQETSHRRFVRKTERHLARIYPKLFTALFVARAYKEDCPNANIDSRVERALPEISEATAEQVKKTMAKLSGLVAAETED